jgi:methionyl-tRNA synthetase
VFYVWFDAPIGYISITAAYCGAEKWQLWWKTPEDVELVQFFGKDNIPFHTVIFPASLIATREPYVLPHLVSATEYLRYCGGKFSKSKGVGVFADGAEQSGIPADVWRYYLLANRPEVSDTSFEWKDFAAKNNTELANTLGNFVQRTLCFVRDKLDSTVPTFVASAIETQRDTDVKFINACTEHTRLVIAQLETTHIKDALKTTIQVARLSNLYWQETKPWEEYANNNHTRCSTVTTFHIFSHKHKRIRAHYPHFTHIELAPHSAMFGAHHHDYGHYIHTHTHIYIYMCVCVCV